MLTKPDCIGRLIRLGKHVCAHSQFETDGASSNTGSLHLPHSDLEGISYKAYNYMQIQRARKWRKDSCCNDPQHLLQCRQHQSCQYCSVISSPSLFLTLSIPVLRSNTGQLAYMRCQFAHASNIHFSSAPTCVVRML